MTTIAMGSDNLGQHGAALCELNRSLALDSDNMEAHFAIGKQAPKNFIAMNELQCLFRLYLALSKTKFQAWPSPSSQSTCVGSKRRNWPPYCCADTL